MRGTMLWFNLDKGHGFILTEEGERLYVDSSGFLRNHEPKPRCKGLEVTFHRLEREGVPRAVEVSFVAHAQPQRARLRMPRSGRSL
jgi:cold shock CspA family protein